MKVCNMKLKLILTCGACPEQYDVVDENDNKIAYLRLRHGHFRAEYPYNDGKIVFQSMPNGDGVFEVEERPIHIGNALLAIKKAIAEERDNDKAIAAYKEAWSEEDNEQLFSWDKIKARF